MLQDNLKTQLKSYLERLVEPVEIIVSPDDSDNSREMLELIQRSEERRVGKEC